MICKKCKKEIPEESVFCMFCGVRQKTVESRSVKKRGNGQGCVYKLPNGKYRAVATVGYYNEDGKKKRRTVSREFIKKSDAVASLPSLKQSYEKPVDINLHDLYDVYTSGKDYDALSKSQRDKMTYAWRRLSPLEFRGITTLTVDDLQTTIDGSATTYYPARDMKVLLSHLYKIAIRREIISLNKTEYIELPDSPKAKRECWTSDEVAAFWNDYEAHAFTGYILIMCYAGIRYGELSTILLDNIHLEEQYMIGGIKTEAGINREIPIHHRLVPVISTLIYPRKRKLLEMNEDNFYEKYWQTIERTGVRPLPPHTCRHYYFSSMTAAGVQGGIIAETGGHASFLTTMKNYVRIPLSDKIDAVNKIQ